MSIFKNKKQKEFTKALIDKRTADINAKLEASEAKVTELEASLAEKELEDNLNLSPDEGEVKSEEQIIDDALAELYERKGE